MHDSSALRRVVTLAAILSGVSVTAGCADTSDPSGALAIVVGARSNMPAPALSGHATEALDAALASEARLSIVVADGAPFEAQGGQLATSDANAQAEAEDRAQLREMVEEAVGDVRAETGETDLLAALELAARELDSATGAHTVVVLDSGLSTAGVLNFAAEPALLDQDPAAVAADLAAERQLPDLSGTTVVFQGLGDTFAPQPALSRPQRSHLVDLWSAIATEAGAEVEVEQSPLDQPPAGALPRVSPVPTGEGATCTVTLTSRDVAFQPDSAEFLDVEAAAAVLAPLAGRLEEAGVSALLTGTTARVGDAGGQVRLSLERAQAVGHLLVELGAPAGSMTTLGLGSAFPGYVEDHGADGQLIAERAEQNRKVMVELAGEGHLDCG